MIQGRQVRTFRSRCGIDQRWREPLFLFASNQRSEEIANVVPFFSTSNEVKASEKIHVAASGKKGTVHPAATHKAAAKKPLAKMTCEGFVGLDESFQPKAVYWAVAYGKGGKPEADEVAAEGVETVVPVVVQECKKAPKESFWEKVKAEWKKVEAKL